MFACREIQYHRGKILGIQNYWAGHGGKADRAKHGTGERGRGNAEQAGGISANAGCKDCQFRV
jgi:hypothetical protein